MRTTVLCFTIMLAAGCGGNGDGCTTLTGSGNLAGVGIGPPQVMIETKFILIDRDSFNDLGIDFSLPTPVETDTPTAPGGVSNQGSDVVADGATVGGPPGVPYLVPDMHNGYVSLVNFNFVSPFAGQSLKVFMTLPFPGECVTIDSSVADAIENFAGGADQAPLTPADPGLDGDVLYEMPDAAALADFLSLIGGDTRNKILDAPTVTTFDGQSALFILQETNPLTSDLTPPFQSAVQSVVTTPFEISSGVALQIRPQISADRQSVTLSVLPVLGLSFQRSVPAQVNGQSVDIEIPVVAPSTVKTSVTVADGQTVVLGDLRRQSQTLTERGIPILGNLPVVGTLFRKESNANQNLILVVKPTIIQGQEE